MLLPIYSLFFKKICLLQKQRFLKTSSVQSQGLAEQFLKAVQDTRVICRTKQENPTLHSTQHEGLVYTVAPSDSQKWFSKGQMKHFPNMIKAFGETGIMVRKPALEIFRYLGTCNYNLPVLRIVLFGGNGCGKTITMSHVMHLCGSQKWLVLHVPWGAAYTKYSKEHQLSSSRSGRVDLPLDAAEWLSYFRTMNSDFIKENNPKVEGSYTWTKREKAEPGTPWLEIIEFGLARPKYASDIVGVLVREIKSQTSQKKFRTLCAIDGVNAFWDKTNIKREDNRRFKYDPEDLSLVHNFKKLLKNDWCNGAVVCSVDYHARWEVTTDSFLPRFLLGKEGFEWFDPFLPIHVPAYSDKEIHSILDYYLDRQWIQNPKGATKEGKEELIFLSDHNPLELFKVSSVW